jgi:uncharacterized membrane protein YhiD involved in acid resistance
MDQVNFADLFKKSFIAMAGTADRVTPLDITINLLASFCIGMFIFYIYKKTFQGVLYQKSFNVSIVIITSVTSLIIMTISGNLVLSLGMVGALSIVRFRTPIKDSMDLTFIFWAICVGIANGVGYYNISLIGSLLIGLMMLFLTRKDEVDCPYLLVLQLPMHVKEQDVLARVKSAVRKYKIQSKTVTDMFQELTFEVKLKSDDHMFVTDLKRDELITKGTLIAYSGDMSSV